MRQEADSIDVMMQSKMSDL